MSQASSHTHDALAALERLYHKKVVSLEEGQTAARLIAQDDAYAFPPPPPPKPAPAPAPREPAAPPPAPSEPEAPPPTASPSAESPSPE